MVFEKHNDVLFLFIKSEFAKSSTALYEIKIQAVGDLYE